MIDFSNVQNIVIPEGEVAVISRNGEILWQKARLPLEYQEVEYLESTGTQWIDTGVLATKTTDFEFVGAITENTKTGWIVGAPTWVGIHKKLGTVAVTQTSSGHTYVPVGICEVFTIGLFGDKAYFNGAETNTLTRNKSTMTLFLFAYHHTNNTGSITSAIRMNSFKIWESGVLIREYVPCYRKSDNKPGMYDLATKEFFTNTGTGEFTYVIQ